MKPPSTSSIFAARRDASANRTPRCLPSTLSLGLVAEELQQLVFQHNIGGFVLGNCLSSQYKKKAKEMESFVEDLSATGLFKDMKYIHWTSSLVYQLLGSPICNHTYNFFVRCKVSSFDIKRVKKDADKRVAAGVLQSYLIEMDWGASSGDDPSDLETSLYELVYGS